MTKQQLEFIEKVYTDFTYKGVLNPLELNKAFDLINNQDENYLHSTRTKKNVITRFMLLQFETLFKYVSMQELFEEPYGEDKEINSYSDDKAYLVDDEQIIDATTSTIPDDEKTVSPKKKSRKKQSHKE